MHKPHFARRLLTGLIVSLGVALFAVPMAHAESQSVAALPPSIDHLYFSDCQHTLAYAFLGYWYANSGMSAFGCPISEELSLDGLTVQYFQYGRLEFHPAADGKASYVSVTNLGRLVNDARDSDDLTLLRRAKIAAQRASAATSNVIQTSISVQPVYTVADPFKATWQGNQALYGVPITDSYPMFMEGAIYTAQDFERGRLLYDPTSDTVTPYDLGFTALGLAGFTSTPVANTNKYWTWDGLNEHWVDVNLSKETETFMQGPIPVRTASIVSGKPGDETPVGTFHILERVPNAEMKNGKPGDKDYYDLKNVLYTQYFTWQGHALHYAYWWNGHFGFQGSHGCVNQDLATSKFAWDYLSLGSRVVIHY